MTAIRAILHAEGAAIFILATWAYFAHVHGSPLWYALLLLAPDLSMVGYARDAALGAWTYNLVHNEALPAVLLLLGLATGVTPLLWAALILAAQVGMDRALGFGLKSPDNFKRTHLQQLGTR
jgi:hypothetical protein